MNWNSPASHALGFCSSMYAFLYLATLSVFLICSFLSVCHSQLVTDPHRASLGWNYTAQALGFPLELSPLHTGPGSVCLLLRALSTEPHTHLLSDHDSHRYHTSCSSLQPPEGPMALFGFFVFVLISLEMTSLWRE